MESVRVLIVEDDEDDFVILAETLAEIADKEIDYHHATGIAEAMACVRRTGYDLCFCDYRIGVRNGIEFIEALEAEGIDLPVVMVTGESKDEVEVVAANAGAFDYIDKQRLSVGRINTAIRYTMAKKARDELRQARDDAERVARLHSAFLSLIGHELRTPINGILGFCDLMASEPHGPLGAEQYHGYLDDIRQSGTRLHETVESILSFTQLIAGTAQTHDEIIHPANEIDYSVHGFRNALAAKAMHLKIEVDGQVRLMADRGSVRKVVSNLLSNSIKFSRRGGTIHIADALLETGGYSITVCDGGEGIPHHAVPNALQPFRQKDEGLSRRYEGLGLGLPLVRSLMELHGGRVEVSKGTEGGACVGIVFPPERIVAEDDAAQPRYA